MSEPILSLDQLNVRFATSRGSVAAVRSADLAIFKGETLALVGESGSGKSTLAKALIRLNDAPFSQARAEISGRALLRVGNEVIDLVSASRSQMRQIRARHVAMVAQDALSGLNPVVRIGRQVAEALQSAFPGLTRTMLDDKVVELLDEVGLPDPGKIVSRFPHQLSGGQRQRIMIAMAVARGPQLLIADEPTTALDVSVQARILQLMKRLQAQSGAATLFITHDLGVVANFADRVAVMYAGEIVEVAPVADFLRQPMHPYTAGLIASVPGSHRQFPRLKGNAPDPLSVPSGCAFRDRCPAAMATCEAAPPMATPTMITQANRQARCWRTAA